MGLLFILLLGILAIFLIAGMASKARPKHERLSQDPSQNGDRSVGENRDREAERCNIEGLTSLLIKKGIITEEELLSEVELIEKIKGQH
ncbi:MAG: hypothetical protein ACE5HN_03960 [Nitrospiria bacterium]